MERLPAALDGRRAGQPAWRSMYLAGTVYRVHGTNTPETIGEAGGVGLFPSLQGHLRSLFW